MVKVPERLLTHLKSAIVACLALSAAACGVKKATDGGGGASMVIRFPSSSELSQKTGVSSQTTTYDFSKACFAVNITAADIPGVPSASCDVPLGLFSGFVLPGTTVSLSVPHGTARRLEVFSYLRTNSMDPCPTNQNTFRGLNDSKIVRLGNQVSFDALEPTVNITVDISAPASGASVISQYSLPANCASTTAPLPPGNVNITAAHATVSGGNYQIVGAVSGIKNEVLLQGGNYKVQLSRRPQ